MTSLQALERLEKAAEGNRVATNILFEATRKLADLVCKSAPVNTRLPRDYEVARFTSNVGSKRFLVRHFYDEECREWYREYIDGTGGYLHGDLSVPFPSQTRQACLAFAIDVADGWLDELAAWLEARATDATSAATILEAGDRVMKSNLCEYCPNPSDGKHWLQHMAEAHLREYQATQALLERKAAAWGRVVEAWDKGAEPYTLYPLINSLFQGLQGPPSHDR